MSPPHPHLYLWWLIGFFTGAAGSAAKRWGATSYKYPHLGSRCSDMAATLTATPGSSSANSYLSLAAAADIAETRPDSTAWDTATSDAQTRALITATASLDALTWIGTRATTTQALAWPRTDASCDDLSYADDEIPPPLQQACFDLAAALLVTPTLLQSPAAGASLVPGVPNRDLRRLKADVLELEWRTDVTPTSAKAPTALSALPHLATLLGCLTTSVPGGSVGRLIGVERS